jgi:hypothetical protein
LIGPHTNDDESHAMLRQTVVGRIQETPVHPVFSFGLRDAGEGCEMPIPVATARL